MEEKLPKWKENKLAYISKYNRETYYTFTIKCRKGEDDDIINFLRSQDKMGATVRKAIRSLMASIKK